MSHKITTVQRHIMDTQRRYPQASGEFSELLTQIILAAKLISREVNKAGLTNILGATGTINVHGEKVQKLDEFANQIMFDALDHGGHLSIMASEESKEPIPIPDEFPTGKYAILFDPLDGSSNIDVNVSVGTIFSIHRKISSGKRGRLEDLLQPGYKQAGAGYIIYGSSSMMVYSTGLGVHGFTLDPSVGEFLLSHENMKIPRFAANYSSNEGNFAYWSDSIQRYFTHIKEHDPVTKRPYQLRYTGSLVSDIHRTLLNGGIFLYPARKNPGTGEVRGKLRLAYECAPMAYLIEQAGGIATTGSKRVLDVVPKELHETMAFFAGSPDNVLEVLGFLKEEEDFV
jgi:fructose-1,6-bisphosphatase I